MSAEESAELYRLIRELTKEVATLSVAVARLEQQIQGRKECPAPGLCLSLQPRIEALEKAANISAGERAGLTLAGKAIWAFIGGGGLALVGAAYAILSK
jgi:hypothetical protein